MIPEIHFSIVENFDPFTHKVLSLSAVVFPSPPPPYVPRSAHARSPMQIVSGFLHVSGRCFLAHRLQTHWTESGDHDAMARTTVLHSLVDVDVIDTTLLPPLVLSHCRHWYRIQLATVCLCACALDQNYSISPQEGVDIQTYSILVFMKPRV